eukprot:Gb_03191 [translate_table: standard]
MKWASYLQQFHLVIKYKKGAHNQVADFLSRPPICTLLSVLDTKCSGYTEWRDLYSTDPDFGSIYSAIQTPLSLNMQPFKDYHLKDGLLYKFQQLYVPQGNRRDQLLKEAHSSNYGGHFGMLKTLLHLQQYFF